MNLRKEIGINKVLKFSVFSLLQIVYGLLIFPPLRSIFLNILGANINLSSLIMNVKFFNWHQKGPKALLVGKDCYIGDETLLDLYDSIVIEDEVTIAQRVLILTHLNVGYSNHPLQKYFPKISKKVVIKRGAVIGAGVTILPGVTIGQKAFIAAGSVVTKNIAASHLVGGVPAKVIRKII